MNVGAFKISPPQFLIGMFICFLGVGTVLLKLPIATAEHISWLDAFFTITSATTVTGLTVVDTGTVYTLFGQIVIMAWIQMGGLGIMSFAILLFIMLGKKITFRERILIQQSLNQPSIGGIIRLVRNLFLFAFTIEALAAACLATRWVPELGWGKGLYFSIFHAVSAFNNAGFGLLPNNLMNYVGDPVINIVISLLIIIGGLGFAVLIEIWVKPNFRKMSLHSKIMIIGTLVLNVAAMVVILLLERNNPGTIGNLSSSQQVLASYFQAVSPRTAGFNTIDLAAMNDSTAFFMMILMFIGAGSGSTGGGIKLTTFVVIIFAVVTFLKGRKNLVIEGRSIGQNTVLKALAIATVSILFVITAIFILTITEDAALTEIMFEVFSAFGTVGLTMGLTYHLTVTGKLVLIFIMFLGKIGPLTLVYSLAKKEKESVRYPAEDVLTG
ncbi:MAG: TrkH family potassium uptake protein [Bacillus sp. (in: firmicutes)]